MKPPDPVRIAPSKMMGMELTNLAYLFLALYMANRRDTGAALMFYVFAVSTIHHYYAYNRAWFWFDIFVATSVSILLACIYVPLGKTTSPTFLSALIIGALAIALFLNSGSDYTSTRFEMYHGLWHVLTAISFFLILKSAGK